MRVFSELDRFHLAQEAANAVYANAEDAKTSQYKWMKHWQNIMTLFEQKVVIFRSRKLKWQELKRKRYHFS